MFTDAGKPTAAPVKPASTTAPAHSDTGQRSASAIASPAS